MRPQLDQTAEDLKSKIARDREQLARFQSSVEQTRALMAEKDETSSEYHSLEQQLTQNLEIINFFEVIIKQDKEEISHLEVTEKMTEEDIYNLCEDYELFQDIVDKGNLYHIVKKFPHRHDLLEQLKKPQEFERLIPDLYCLVTLLQVTNNQGVDSIMSIFLENSEEFIRLVDGIAGFGLFLKDFPEAYQEEVCVKFIDFLIDPALEEGHIESLLSTGLCLLFALSKHERLRESEIFETLSSRYEAHIVKPAFDDFGLFEKIINGNHKNFIDLVLLFEDHKNELFKQFISNPDFFNQVYNHDHSEFFKWKFPSYSDIFSVKNTREQVVEEICRLAVSDAETEKNQEECVEVARVSFNSSCILWQEPEDDDCSEEQEEDTVEENVLAAQ